MDVVDVAATTVVGMAVSGVVVALIARTRERLPGRVRWGLQQPDRVQIFLSASATTETAQYSRRATGLGQAVALSIIASSMVRAYRDVDLQRVTLSGNRQDIAAGLLFEGDAVALGGPNSNAATHRILEAAGRQNLPVKFEAVDGVTRLHVSVAGTDEVYGATYGDERSVTSDVGLIVRMPNPFGGSGTVVVLAGIHTFGTIAAARAMVETAVLRSAIPWRSPRLYAVISAEVSDERVGPPTIRRAGTW